MKGRNKDKQRRAIFAKKNAASSYNSPTIFFPAKNKRAARIIKIDSPSNYRKSIQILKKGGLTTTEKRALILAQNRAKAQLKRSNITIKERKQFKQISKIKVK